MNTKCLPNLILGICFMLASCSSVPKSAEPSPTIAPSQTATPTPSPTFTPTPLQPILSVRSEISCYAGPGDIYGLVTNLQAGEEVEIVGKTESFWVVALPTNTECWVADEHVNIEGEVSTLPNVAPPSTPTPSIPAPPKNLRLDRALCWMDKSQGSTMYIYEFHLAWTDASANEDGFRIYRSGDLVAEVPANAEKAIDKHSRRWLNTVYYYQVAAFNEIGESKGEIIPLTCGGQ